MGRTLKNELRRACSNPAFIGALGVGMIVALANIALVAFPYATSDVWSAWRSGAKAGYPLSFHHSWIGQTSFSVTTVIFYWLVPLLACIPFAASLNEDLGSRYADQVIVRVGKSRYFAAKLVASVVSSVAVVAIPLLVNVAFAACLVPDIPPEPAAGTFYVAPNTMLVDLFYESPWAYVALFIAMAAALGAVCATASCCISFVASNRLIALLVPFGVCAFMQLAFQGTVLAGFSPLNVILPYQPFSSIFWVVCLCFALTCAALIGFFAYKGFRYESV